MKEALLRHPEASDMQVRTYHEFNKLLMASKHSLPRFTNNLTSPVFQIVMAMHLCLAFTVLRDLCLLCPPHMRWRTGHDSLKVVFINICNKARVTNYCEVFGLFRDTILAELGGPGGKLQYA